MTPADMAAALAEVQARLAGADLVAEWLHGLYHCAANLALTVTGDSTMHGEGRITALCVKPSGAAIREVGTIALDYTRTAGTWLMSRQAVTIQRRDPVA